MAVIHFHETGECAFTLKYPHGIVGILPPITDPEEIQLRILHDQSINGLKKGDERDEGWFVVKNGKHEPLTPENKALNADEPRIVEVSEEKEETRQEEIAEESIKIPDDCFVNEDGEVEELPPLEEVVDGIWVVNSPDDTVEQEKEDQNTLQTGGTNIHAGKVVHIQPLPQGQVALPRGLRRNPDHVVLQERRHPAGHRAVRHRIPQVHVPHHFALRDPRDDPEDPNAGERD